MKSKTEEIRATQLIEEVMDHKHKDELIDIMYQQIQDENDNRYKTIPAS
tara:strand:- start:1023 stop:1169 length:147 start_codon:yes stop_codon:yes gene_type:complete